MSGRVGNVSHSWPNMCLRALAICEQSGTTVKCAVSVRRRLLCLTGLIFSRPALHEGCCFAHYGLTKELYKDVERYQFIH
jgi:hypothetical protein